MHVWVNGKLDGRTDGGMHGWMCMYMDCAGTCICMCKCNNTRLTNTSPDYYAKSRTVAKYGSLNTEALMYTAASAHLYAPFTQGSSVCLCGSVCDCMMRVRAWVCVQHSAPETRNPECVEHTDSIMIEVTTLASSHQDAVNDFKPEYCTTWLSHNA